ncbi:MAG: MFS transporter [Planctomycetes bacterium]|nr:MFS transporter [Planctomycetota bacterium]
MTPKLPHPDAPLWLGLSRNVLILGLVSFLTDTASEMLVPLLPIFLATELNAGALHIGWIAGLSESLASFLKLGSGWLSDRLHRRKLLIVLGYGVASLVRPLMGLATSWWHVMAVRVVDRVGKGVRIAPRDALLADSCDEAVRGRAFGFQQMADHLGAAIGPLLALALLVAHASIRTIFLLSIVPGVLVLLAAGVGITEKPPKRAAVPVRLTLAPFDGRFRLYLVATLLFHLAVASEFFLILRMKDGGLHDAAVLLVWSAFMAARSACAMLGGVLSDRFGRRTLISAGWLLFAAAWGALAWAPRGWVVLPLAAYALFHGLSQGPQRAFVADLVPEHLRGTAYGVYAFVLGIATLVANPTFGWVSVRFGMPWAFLGGAVLALAGLATLAFVRRQGAIGGSVVGGL